MSFKIRRAQSEDAEAVCRVVLRSIELCCFDDHKGDPKIISTWLANKTPENIQTWFNSSGYAVLAEKSGVVVGVAMLSGSGCILLNYLAPEIRFQGVGKAVLAALEAEGRNRGFSNLSLTSTLTAHQFYLRNGYVDTGKTESVLGLSLPCMTKAIGPTTMSNRAAEAGSLSRAGSPKR